MKIKKYTNGAWTDLDKPVKKFDTYTDEATTLPLTIQTSATDAVENYQVYGTSAGAGAETENVLINEPYKTNYYITENGQEYAIDEFNIYVTKTLDTSLGEYSFYFVVYQLNKTVRVHGYSNGVWQQQITAFSNIHSITITKPQGIDEIRISCAVGYTGRTLVEGSTAPTSYIPYGYKIPILNTSGVTENLFYSDVTQTYTTSRYTIKQTVNSSEFEIVSLSTEKADTSALIPVNIPLSSGTYTLSVFGLNYISSAFDRIYLVDSNSTAVVNMVQEAVPRRFSIDSNVTISKIGFVFSKTSTYTNQKVKVMLVKSSTPPDHYIPHRYESNYDLFIGDSKLGEDEYLDYGEQKMHKNVSGVLTPTDPPAPFPALSTYIGENNLSVDTTIQPEKVAVEYEGWKGVGDVEKYQNGEWSDNNGT